MSRFGNVKKQVRTILSLSEPTRNCDRRLYLQVLSTYYDVDGDTSLEEWASADCPDFESVRRSRASIQEAGEFLPTDPTVIAARRRKEGEVREELGYDPAPRDSGAEARAARADVAARTYHPNVKPAPFGGALFDIGRAPDAH